MHARIVVTILMIGFSFTTSGLAQSQADQKEKDHFPETKSSASCGPRNKLSSAQFQLVLQTVRDAWVAGEAERVVGCFAPGATFSLPPSIGIVGRENLLQVFGAGHKAEPPKSIEWHHVVFDPAQQIGAVEFTMQRRVQSHGVVIIKISGGLISNWRQYAIASDLAWEKFIGMNKF
jgi:hypothetical protein